MTDNVEQPQAEQVNEGLSVEEIRDARKRLSELEDKLKVTSSYCVCVCVCVLSVRCAGNGNGLVCVSE